MNTKTLTPQQKVELDARLAKARNAEDFENAAYEMGINPENIREYSNQVRIRNGKKSLTFARNGGRDYSKGYRTMIARGIMALLTGLGAFIFFVLPRLH